MSKRSKREKLERSEVYRLQTFKMLTARCQVVDGPFAAGAPVASLPQVEPPHGSLVNPSLRSIYQSLFLQKQKGWPSPRRVHTFDGSITRCGTPIPFFRCSKVLIRISHFAIILAPSACHWTNI